MVKEIRLYFEGHHTLKRGFDHFLRELKNAARAAKVEFWPVAAGGDPVSDYRKGVRAHPEALCLLLRDSESPLGPKQLEHCRKHGIATENVFWMVELMESWFLADPDAFIAVFGPGAKPEVLGSPTNVETVPKRDVQDRIARAVQGTKRRRYHKTRDAPDLLRNLNPERVRARAPHCQEMFDSIHAHLLG